MDPRDTRRQYLRFPPEPAEFAQIDKRVDAETFEFQYVALIVEESPLGGCGLAMLDQVGLDVGDMCRIRLGNLEPLTAEVVWRKPLEGSIIRYGVRFLE
jgi:hypothetical protein